MRSSIFLFVSDFISAHPHAVYSEASAEHIFLAASVTKVWTRLVGGSDSIMPQNVPFRGLISGHLLGPGKNVESEIEPAF